MRYKYNNGEVLQMASLMLAFEIFQLRREGKDFVLSQLQQELNARHSCKFGRASRRKTSEFVKLYRREHAQLARETGFVCLFSQQNLIRNINNYLPC